MSTFVFAPSWITYPNQPKSQASKEDFPTLLSNRNNKNSNNTSSDNSTGVNNVWSNSHLIRKIHNSGDEQDEDNEEVDIKRCEFERLKALVPKTKKSLSSASSKGTANTSNSSSIKRKSAPLPLHRTKSSITPNAAKPINKSAENLPPTTTTNNNNTNNNIATIATNTSQLATPIPEKQPTKDMVSKEEQQKFLYFLKFWTSTRIVSHHHESHHNESNHLQEYSHFSFNANYCNNRTSSRSSSSSSNSSSSVSSVKTPSDKAALDTSNDSYFSHNPFLTR